MERNYTELYECLGNLSVCITETIDACKKQFPELAPSVEDLGRRLEAVYVQVSLVQEAEYVRSNKTREPRIS